MLNNSNSKDTLNRYETIAVYKVNEKYDKVNEKLAKIERILRGMSSGEMQTDDDQS